MKRLSPRFVIPAHAEIQVADNVRHTGEGRYPGEAAGFRLDTRFRGYDGEKSATTEGSPSSAKADKQIG